MNFKAVSAPHSENAHFSLPLFGREPRTSRSAQALGKRVESAAGPTEEQSGTITAPPALARTTSFRPKKGGANGSSLGHFFDLSGSFPPIAPTAFDTHADARSKGGETAKELYRARAHNTEFLFFAFTHRQ